MPNSDVFRMKSLGADIYWDQKGEIWKKKSERPVQLSPEKALNLLPLGWWWCSGGAACSALAGAKIFLWSHSDARPSLNSEMTIQLRIWVSFS